jgi:hypothetical protein
MKKPIKRHQRLIQEALDFDAKGERPMSALSHTEYYTYVVPDYLCDMEDDEKANFYLLIVASKGGL